MSSQIAAPAMAGAHDSTVPPRAFGTYLYRCLLALSCL